VYKYCSIDWSGSHGYLASGGGDNNIVITRVAHESEGGGLVKEYCKEEAHDGDVNCVRWNSADNLGHLLVSVGDDSAVKIWQLVL
jgi:cytosolic iron-sulfur protein assembly protein CIAO1